MIEDLAATPKWWLRRLLPGDVTSLRRRWPKVLFRTMRKRLMDMEQLRRDCHNRPDWEFRHSQPGYCSLCQEQVATAFVRHMMNVHLEQLWWCPVEWCTVWKGSLCDCLGHLHEKHGGSQYVAMNNLGKFFSPCTVPRDFWQTALRPDVSGMAVDVRLFHESGCRMVHEYRVYRDPFPHQALRGRVMNKLLALVARAMTIAELTQLHITIPSFFCQRGYRPWYFPRNRIGCQTRYRWTCRIFRFMNRSMHCFPRRIPWTYLLQSRNWTSVASCPAGFRVLHMGGGYWGTGRQPFYIRFFCGTARMVPAGASRCFR